MRHRPLFFNINSAEMESSLHFSSRRSKLSAASVSPHFSRRLEICVLMPRAIIEEKEKRVIDKRKENDGAIRRVGRSGAVFLFP